MINARICYFLSACLVGSLAGGLSGCLFSECTAVNDCPSGQFCSSGKCVQSTAESTLDTGYSNPNNNSGSTQIEENFLTNFPVFWLGRDRRDGTDDLLYAYTDQSGQLDQVLRFENNSDDFPGEVDIDFILSSDGRCSPIEIVFESELTTNASDNEMWVVCQEEPTLRIIYEDDLDLASLREDANVHFGISVESSQAGFYNMDRRLWANRETGEIVSFQIRPDDFREQPRVRDDTSALSFSAISQMWQLDSTVDGDVVLVFDRSSPPRLQPIFRLHGTETWEEGPASLPAATLPAETHAIVVLSKIDPFGVDVDIGNPNIMAIEPETGMVRFYAYGASLQNGQPFFVGEYQYEAQPEFLMPLPPLESLLMLEPAANQVDVVYSHPSSRRIYLLPTHILGMDDVLSFTSATNQLTASSIEVIDSDSVWAAYPYANTLMRVRLDN